MLPLVPLAWHHREGGMLLQIGLILVRSAERDLGGFVDLGVFEIKQLGVIAVA